MTLFIVLTLFEKKQLYKHMLSCYWHDVSFFNIIVITNTYNFHLLLFVLLHNHNKVLQGLVSYRNKHVHSIFFFCNL